MLLLNFRSPLLPDEERAIIDRLATTSLFDQVLCPINTTHKGILVQEVCTTIKDCLAQASSHKVQLTMLLLPYHSVKAAFIIGCYHRLYNTLPNVLQFGYAGIGSEKITKIAICTSLERCVEIWPASLERKAK